MTDAPERWALVINDQIVWGPGPLPYMHTMPNGDLVQPHALTMEQRVGLGFTQVEIRNWLDIDVEIQSRKEPLVYLDEGTPVEEYSHEFVPGARDMMIQRVDERAEEARKTFITSAPGQSMEYQEAARQAAAAVLTPATLQPGQYPFLDTDVGSTINPFTGETVATILEAAEIILATRDMWIQAATAIRAVRLSSKAAIRAAETDAAAFAIYNAIQWPA